MHASTAAPVGGGRASADEPPSREPQLVGQSGGTPRFSGAVVAVLGAIASSIGVIGFVIFVGGAVQVARDRGVGLSAPFAVPLVPRTQLLASGADQLFAPLVYTLAVVGLMTAYLVNRRRIPKKLEPGLRWALLGGGAIAAIAIFQSNTGAPTPAPFDRGDNQSACLGAICVLAIGVWLVNRLIAGEQDPAVALARSPRLLSALGVVAGTVIAFSALLVFAHNEWEPSVHPIALIGPKYPGGLTGVYVGEDSSRVYVGIIGAPLGKIGNKRLKTRIMEVPRSDITAMTIGGLFPLANFVPAKSSRAQGWPKQLAGAEECLREELLTGRVLSTTTCVR
jgi:hypothetical protein